MKEGEGEKIAMFFRPMAQSYIYKLSVLFNGENNVQVIYNISDPVF